MGNQPSTPAKQQANPTEPNGLDGVLAAIDGRQPKQKAQPTQKAQVGFGGPKKDPKIDHQEATAAARYADRERHKKLSEKQREEDKKRNDEQLAKHADDLRELNEAAALARTRTETAAQPPRTSSPGRQRTASLVPTGSVTLQGPLGYQALRFLGSHGSLHNDARGFFPAGGRVGRSPARVPVGRRIGRSPAPGQRTPTETPEQDEDNEKGSTSWLIIVVSALVLAAISCGFESFFTKKDGSSDLSIYTNIPRIFVYSGLSYAGKKAWDSSHDADTTRNILDGSGGLAKVFLIMLVLVVVSFSIMRPQHTWDVTLTGAQSAHTWLFPPETDEAKAARLLAEAALNATNLALAEAARVARDALHREAEAAPEANPKGNDQCAVLYRNVTTLGHIAKFVLALEAKSGNGDANRRMAFYTLCAAMDPGAQEYIQSAVKCACVANDNRSVKDVKTYLSNSHMSMRDLFRAFGSNRIKEIIKKPTDAGFVTGVRVPVRLNGHTIQLIVPFGDIRLLRLVDFLQAYNSMDASVVSADQKIALRRFVGNLGEDLDLSQTGTISIATELMRPMIGFKKGNQIDDTHYTKEVARMFEGRAGFLFEIFDDQTRLAFLGMKKYFETEENADAHTNEVVKTLIVDFEKFRVGETLTAFGKPHKTHTPTGKTHRTEEEKKAHRKKRESEKAQGR